MSIIDSLRKFGQSTNIFPTKIELPLWEVGLITSVSRIQFVDQEVKQIDEKPNFVGLKKPSFADYLSESLNPDDYLNYIRSKAPVDGREVVEWMHQAFADYAILNARAEEYSSVGGQIVGNSNDGFIPGVSVENLHFQSVSGSTVSNRGFGILITPYGNVNVPSEGKATITFSNLLAWAAIPWVTIIQWGGVILKWKSLAKTPINQTMGFVSASGLSAPQFIAVSPRRPAVRVRVLANFSSNQEQTLEIKIRNPNNFSQVMAHTSVNIPSGQSNVIFTLRGLPYVSTTVWEIQPEDRTQTALNKMDTHP